MIRWSLSSICTLKSSFVNPGAATSTLYSLSSSMMLIAGAELLVFVIHSFPKKSLKIPGHQLGEFFAGVRSVPPKLNYTIILNCNENWF